MFNRRLFLKGMAGCGVFIAADGMEALSQTMDAVREANQPVFGSGGIWVSHNARKYSLDEIVFLNGVGGLGASGRLDVSREIVPTDSELGFSLEIDWKAVSGPYWSIRLGLLPESGMTIPDDLDTLEFDLYVAKCSEHAQLNVFLVETDDDRWVCWNHPLSDLKIAQWNHITITWRQMTMWLLGSRKPQWNRLSQIAFEIGGGDILIYVDGVKLTSRNNRTLKVFNTKDDGYYSDPLWKEYIESSHTPGTVFFPFDEGRMGVSALLDTPVQFRKLLGHVGTPLSGFDHEITRKSNNLIRNGVCVIYYASFASGYLRYLTRRQAWDVNAKGRSLNWTPCNHTDWDCQHAIALSHPAVTEALRLKVDALLNAGLGVWMVVDYTFPWWDTLWGYSPAMVDAYRMDLTGKDEGIKTIDKGEEHTVRFHDYFRAYNGFDPQVIDFGMKDWKEFNPPLPDEKSADELIERRMNLFLYLRSYEWVKLPDRIGRYMKHRGGEGLWMVPNPEDSYGSSDYVYLLRSAGVGNLFPEFFGDIGFAAEAGYASLPYLKEQAVRSGAGLSIIQETGAGGHNSPYLDWRIAYNGVYSLTASGGLDDFDNDFLDETTFDQMSDPRKNEYEFKRFRDGIAKAMAFLQAREEKPQRPQTDSLCISERPPAKSCGSIFFGLDQLYSFACGLSRLHFVFDLRDGLELEQALRSKRVLFYSPWAPKVGDLEMLRKWLASGKGHALITHTFVPTRSTREFWGLRPSTKPGQVNGGDILGLGEISETSHTKCTVTHVDDALTSLFPIGETFSFNSPLYACEHGEALINTDAGPLLSRVRVGKGYLYYLHFAPDPSDKTQDLDVRISQAIGRLTGVTPVCEADRETLVQLYHIGRGYSILAWDLASMEKWSFVYKPGIPYMPFEAEGVSRRVTIRVALDYPWWIYDFWTDQMHRVSPRDKKIELMLTGMVSGMFYLFPDEDESQIRLKSVRALRAKMRQLQFDSVGM